MKTSDILHNTMSFNVRFLKLKQNKARIEDFINQFEQAPDMLKEFSLDAWSSLVDYANVYDTDDIRFTFKNGQEILA